MARIPLYQRSKDFESLTDKQQKFVTEYLKDHNASSAAKKAGYKVPATMGAKLCNNKAVKSIIGKYKQEMFQKDELDRLEIVKQLRYGLTRNAKDLVDDDGKLINNINDLSDEIAATIDAIEQEVVTIHDADGNVVKETLQTKLTFNRKSTYIDMAMKHMGMYEKQLAEVTHRIDWDSIAQGNKRINSSDDLIEAEILSIT